MNTQAVTPAAPASGSTSPGNASAAAAASKAAAPGGGMQTMQTAAVEPTPGTEQLSEDDLIASFMGTGPAEVKPAKKEANTTDEDTESEEEETETDEETEVDDTEETEEETETETEEEETEDEDTESEEESETEEEPEGDLDKGLLKALKDKPGLHKRIKKLFAQNKELKVRLEGLEVEPAVLTPPTESDLLADARSEAEVEQKAAAIQQDARSKLRWLNRHLDGGTWAEGTAQAWEMTAEDVDAQIERYETILSGVDQAKSARQAWLKRYGETAKELGAEVKLLLDAKSDSREAKLLRLVPELTRDAEFLRVLADAKAGRELRAKKAKGIQVVEVDPNKAKAKKAKANGGKGAASPNKGQEERSRSGEQRTETQPLTQAQLHELRERAAKGDPEADEALLASFLA